MNFVRIFLAAVLVGGLTGCGLGNDENGPNAIRLAQEFKPSASSATVAERMKETFVNAEWTVAQTNEHFYRVVCRGVASGQAKEIVFGVNVHKGHVMALNRDALDFTTPM